MAKENDLSGDLFPPLNQVLARAGSGLMKPMEGAPPQDIAMEQAVLGALMLERSAIAHVRDILRPDSFYRDGHRRIYEAILALDSRSAPIDILTVKNELVTMDAAELAGGAHYLSELTSKVASAANIAYHARVIVQKQLARTMMAICQKGLMLSGDESQDVFMVLDQLQADLLNVGKIGLQGKGLMGMSQIIQSVADHMVKVESLPNGKLMGIPSRFHQLNNYTGGWQRQDFIIVGARPSMGKTSWMLDQALFTAMQGLPVAIYSLEMGLVSIGMRMACRIAEVDSMKFRNRTNSQEEMEALQRAFGILAKLPIYIDETSGLSITQFRTRTRTLHEELRDNHRGKDKSKAGLALVLVDYIQMMQGDSTKQKFNRNEELGTVSRGMKETAKELDIPVIALSQLSRDSAKDGKSGKPPSIEGLRDSGNIEQDADMIMFLHRPEYYGIRTTDDGFSTAGLVQQIIAKQRNGPIGIAKARMSLVLQIWTEWDEWGGQTMQSGPELFDTPKTITEGKQPAPRVSKQGKVRRMTDEERGLDEGPPPPDEQQRKDVPF